MRKVIAIDFDGCLCENAWPEIGRINRDIFRAAIEEKRKGAAYYTPETDGLKNPWRHGGGVALYSAIPHTGGKSASGFAKPTKKHRAGQLLFC